MSEHPASPVVWDTAKGAHFSVDPLRVLNHEHHEWGQEEARGVADRTLRGY